MHAVVKSTLIGIVVFVIWVLYKKFAVPLLQRRRLIKQGVVFLDTPFAEIGIITTEGKKFPHNPILNTIPVQLAK